MIITDDKGVEHDGFKRLFEQPWKRLVLLISGGTDSAFSFWFMAKMIEEHNLDKTLIPLYIDVVPDVYGKQAFTYVYEFVKEQFPNVDIEKPLIYEHQPSPIYSKADRLDKIKREIGKDPNYDKLVGFVTAVSDDFNPDLSPGRLDNVHKRRSLEPSERIPLATIDKKGLAEQYRKYDLMESLYPYTKSCTAATRLPCGRCFWCHEKVWAFGTMDKGIVPKY